MAVNFRDPACGFYQKEVVDFINEQILRTSVNPDFNTIQMCKSWSDLEKKLRNILNDSAVPRAIKRSYTWSALALAVRFARRQKQEYREKVKKLEDKLYEQKLFTNVLIGMVDRLRNIQEREKQKAELERQQSLSSLQRVEEERNLFRDELLKVLTMHFQKQDRVQERVWQTKEAQPLDWFAVDKARESYWTRERTVAESGQDTAAATTVFVTVPAPAAAPAPLPAAELAGEPAEEWVAAPAAAAEPAEAPFAALAAAPAAAPAVAEAKAEENTWGNYQGVAFSFNSDVLGKWLQAKPAPPLTGFESSASFVPKIFFPAGAGQTATVPPVNSGASWKGKQLSTRKFWTERFKPVSVLSCFEKCIIKRRVGDWDCDQCFWMNFSWRTECFKCGKCQYSV